MSLSDTPHSASLTSKLKNSEEKFQEMMDSILVNLSNLKCYVDDVVIHSETEETHVKHLVNVFAYYSSWDFESGRRSAHSRSPAWNY